MKGLVIKSTGSRVVVLLEDGRKVDCTLRGQFRLRGSRHTHPVAIGDRVSVDGAAQGNEGVITAIEKRDNYIVRKAKKLTSESHILAANIDHAYLVVTLATPRTSNGFIDRFLVTAAGYYIPSSLVFNKCDLYDENLERQFGLWSAIYEKAGYPCYRVSAVTGEGTPELYRLLAGKVSMFAGHSGAGKSALINCMEPDIRPKIGSLSTVHLKGMHTTTFAEMYPLNNQGFIIDTPGIREFGLVGFGSHEIPRCFPEMERYLPDCQYADCTHTHEPGCAVKKAVEKGDISNLRYNSYLSILNDE